MCACMREAQPSETETPSAAAPEPPVSAPPVPPPAQSEGDSRHRMPRATGSPENTDLGRNVRFLLGWDDTILHTSIRPLLLDAIEYFRANNATADEILRYNAWRKFRGLRKVLKYVIQDFPEFRDDTAPAIGGGIAAPATSGTAARPAQKARDTFAVQPPRPEEKIQRPKHSAYWAGVLERLRTRLHPDNVKAWFEWCDGTKQGEVTVLTAPDNVFRDWITTNYLDVLAQCGITRIEWIINNENFK